MNNLLYRVHVKIGVLLLIVCSIGWTNAIVCLTRDCQSNPLRCIEAVGDIDCSLGNIESCYLEVAEVNGQNYISQQHCNVNGPTDDGCAKSITYNNSVFHGETKPVDVTYHFCYCNTEKCNDLSVLLKPMEPITEGMDDMMDAKKTTPKDTISDPFIHSGSMTRFSPLLTSTAVALVGLRVGAILFV